MAEFSNVALPMFTVWNPPGAIWVFLLDGCNVKSVYTTFDVASIVVSIVLTIGGFPSPIKVSYLSWIPLFVTWKSNTSALYSAVAEASKSCIIVLV